MTKKDYNNSERLIDSNAVWEAKVDALTSRHVISAVQPEEMTDEMINELLRLLDANLMRIIRSIDGLSNVEVMS